MIEVKLNVKEYNRLFMAYLDKDFNDIFCKVQNDSIIFVDNRKCNNAIASVNLNTPEGKILSNYIDCQLRISINDNGDIFICKTCMNSDNPYIGYCDNCKVNHCQCSYSCEKGMLEKIGELDKNVNDIKFIDPIPNRNYYVTEELRRFGFVIEDLYKDFSNNTVDDVRKICETAHLLLSQIKALCEKWKYKEDSSHGNR